MVSRLESQLHQVGLISRMHCRFCHFEFPRAGNYTRHLRNKHPESPAVSVAGRIQPVGDHEETPHAYPNTTILVTMPGRPRRRRSVSLVQDYISSKFPKRHAETGALLSRSGKHSQEESKTSRMMLGWEGRKRLQNIRQTREKRQRADFWNPLLDPDSPSVQAVLHSAGSPNGQAEGSKRRQNIKQATKKR